MYTRQGALLIACGLLLGLESVAFAEGESAVLPGYTPAAAREIERLLSTLDRLKSYSDAGEVLEGYQLSDPRRGRPESVVYQHPNQFRLENGSELILGDGKDLTVARKSMRRYLTEPLRSNWRAQLESHDSFSWNETPTVGKVLSASDRLGYIGQSLKNADVRGREIIEGESCVVLEGVDSSWAVNGQNAKSRWYLRESDGLVRRIVKTIPMGPVGDDVGNAVVGFLGALGALDMNQTTLYDVKNIRVNEPPPPGAFDFVSKASWRKVSKFYDRGQGGTEFGGQIALSGKPTPWFELPLANGTSVNSGALSGKVGVLWLLPDARQLGEGTDDSVFAEWTSKFEAGVGGFPGDQVSAWYVNPDDLDSPLTQSLVRRGLGARTILDSSGTLRDQFVEETWGIGVVLIGKDGTVQGLRRPGCGDEPGVGLKSDIEQLLKGESLPGSVPMSDEEIKEMRFQRRSSGGDDADDFEPLNEDHFVRAWSVRTPSDQFSSGCPDRGEDAIGDGLWVRTDRLLRRVNPQGQVIDEIRLPRRARDLFFSQQTVLMRTSKGRAVVTLAQVANTIKADDGRTQSFGGGYVLWASNDQGDDLWEIALGGDDHSSSPSGLAAADVDSKGGDEVLFAYHGALWLVDEAGTVRVRMPTEGYVSWIRAQDLDGDRKTEVYVRYSDSLERFDYAPKP